ncbi:MAG: tRNA (adenosine(37)-N6)-threonylcarbamoyltransferase complex ATPase subunit type 1 TsaE [Ignavibacteriae bacterium]|nr:tRNA (adenosine(37)-N6)-threonylcarbamoyltransferase complex ATPase subunit type 1 TsaE [Ignavibacteriota bacterium]
MELIFDKTTNSLEESKLIAKEIFSKINLQDVVVLNGNLGTGKTTLIKFICELYKIYNSTSPSFSIVNEYEGDAKVFHFDFYRIKKVEEIYDIGFEDYLNYEESIIFIEWGNLFPDILPKNHFEIQLELNSDNTRIIKFIKHN